jgi:predicted TIM-barrel fold metal-dependent hydrolase
MTNADSVENSAPLYDTHAHFFSNDTQRYPLNTSNAREGEEQLRRRISSDPATPERNFELWDASFVTGGCGVQYNTVYKSDNSYLLDIAERHPDRIAPVVMLDATASDTPATLDKFVRQRGVVGLRLYGRVEADGSLPWLDSPAALRTWDVADRHGLAMVLMFAPAQASAVALPKIAALARRFPVTTLSLDHFGWAGSDPAQLLPPSLLQLREHRNVFYKLTTINYHMLERAGIDSAHFVRRLADVFGADRMMWGSDVGNTLDDYASMARRARASTTLLTSAERQLFLHDTGVRLFARRAGERNAE